jgi:dynein heavy chain 2, cytosolic
MYSTNDKFAQHCIRTEALVRGSALQMQVLIIQEVSSINAILVPLLRKDILFQGIGQSVKIGDKVMDYCSSFKLILTTRDSTISLPPDLKPLLTVTNFTVTRSALESQMLALTIEHEQPQLEEQRRHEPVVQSLLFHLS